MKRYKITPQSPAAFLLLTLLLSITACTSTEVEIEHKVPPVDNTNGIEATLHFNILSTTTPQTRSLTFTQRGTLENTTEAVSTAYIDSLSCSPDKPIGTKADLPESETKLYTVWCGQYDMAGNLIAAKYSENISAENSVQLQLTKSTDDNQLYLVANTGNLSGIAQGKSLSDFRKLTTNTAVTAAGQLTSNKCMMTGSWTGTISGSINGQIDLIRSVAKIVFTYTVGTGVQNFSFTPTSLKLCNVPDALQYEKSITQLTNVSYMAYTSRSSVGIYTWYLPENRAGIAAGADAVFKDADKIGNGVTNATYICLIGDVTQNNVTYNDVTFRLYPGGDENGVDNCNNYNINRNYIYTLDVTLTGIDFTDKRVTVNAPEMVSKVAFDAVKGDVRDFQITVQPGVEWIFQLPGWLSALIDGTTVVNPENIITHSGPARIQLTATSTNPNANVRKTSLDVAGKNVTVTQEGSVFNVSTPKLISISGGSIIVDVTATEGLSWMLNSAGTANGITPPSTNSYTGSQILTFMATDNKGLIRSDIFTFDVTGAIPERSKSVPIIQCGTILYLDNSYVDSYNINKGSDTNYPAVDKNIVAKFIEISETQQNNGMDYYTAKSDCVNMGTGWRLPTYYELHAMYVNKSALECGTDVAFIADAYWSISSYGGGGSNVFCKLLFSNGSFNAQDPTVALHVRCVRDIQL